MSSTWLKFFGSRRLWSTLVLLLPSLIAVYFYGLVASDRYLSEAKFVVRTAARPVGGAGYGAVLQMVGLGQAQDDLYVAQAFMTSREAVKKLGERLSLREIYGLKQADVVSRFPSFLYGDNTEELYAYLRWMVTTIHSSATGVTTLRVQAFRPDDAQQIALELLELGEQAVNAMNARIHRDAVRNGEAAVARDERRLIEAQVAITNFRNREFMIDPGGAALVIAEVIAGLAAEVAQMQAQIIEVAASAPTSPALTALRRRVVALEEQVVNERKKIGGPDTGLAGKLAQFERMALDREFAKQSLTTSLKSLEAAQIEAQRQQLFLQRIVEPLAPDQSMLPDRLRMIASAAGINLIMLLVGWLVFAGLREHGAQE